MHHPVDEDDLAEERHVALLRRLRARWAEIVEAFQRHTNTSSAAAGRPLLAAAMVPADRMRVV